MEQNFYIIRHGETDFNKSGMVQGSGIDSDLNEKGRMQAAAFYSHFSSFPFDKIYVSGLKRTHQSVASFIKKGIPLEIVPELNEISWGDFEGVAISPEMHDRYLNNISEWQKGNLHLAYKNAETPLQLQERQKIALKKILKDTASRNILIATHGRYLRAFLCLLLEQPLHQMDEFNHTNLCLYIIRYKEGKFTMIEACNTLHLEALNEN